MKTHYIIISSVRNEERFIEKTILSVVNQTITPVEWIIIDDGSTDRTREILESYSRSYRWIKVLHNADRGYDNHGIAETQAFSQGVDSIAVKQWDYIVKVDGDVSFEKDYIECLIKRFIENNLLGIAGGTCYFFKKGMLYEEESPRVFPMAAARMYRRRCFEEIGGLQKTLGFDLVDILKAQMRGWETLRFSELEIVHYRLTMSRNGLWHGKKKLGEIYYVAGYDPLFFAARSFYHLFKRPYIIESCASVYGFLRAMVTRKPFVVSPQERAYLRTQQKKRLFQSIKGHTNNV